MDHSHSLVLLTRRETALHVGFSSWLSNHRVNFIDQIYDVQRVLWGVLSFMLMGCVCSRCSSPSKKLLKYQVSEMKSGRAASDPGRAGTLTECKYDVTAT